MPCRPLHKPTGIRRFVIAGAKGLRIPGNIDLYTRPLVSDGHGNFATVYSTSYSTDAGEMVIPQVIPYRGKWSIVSGRTALAYALRTKRHLGIFDTVPHAETYAERLHLQQARIYCLQ